jgi:hypothetical protein
MMKTLQGAYSNFRPNENPEQARVYAEAFERMVGEFGQGRTAAAVASAIDLVPDFCPTVAKIREFVPGPGGQRRTCTDCYPSGFVQVVKPRGWLPSSTPPVARCDHQFGKSPVLDVCPDGGHGYGAADIAELWKIHKKKRAQLGRPLTEAELNSCLNELDMRIDKLGEK